MTDRWESPDVAKDGSIDYGEDGPVERSDNTSRSKLRGIRETLEVFWLRQRNAAWTLVQLAGFAAFIFGAFRLFGIGIYGLDGIGPFSREFFTTVYLPGPWNSFSVIWELAFLWMGIGIMIVGLSTRQRRL